MAHVSHWAAKRVVHGSMSMALFAEPVIMGDVQVAWLTSDVSSSAIIQS